MTDSNRENQQQALRTSKDEILLPCPFCGTADVFVERADYSSCYVQCNGCCVHGPIGVQDGDDEEIPGYAAARREWNKRSSSPSETNHVESPLRRAVRIARGEPGPPTEPVRFAHETGAESAPETSSLFVARSFHEAMMRQLEAGPDEYRVMNLVMFVRRLARLLRKHEPESKAAVQALDYLERKGLQGSPLKAEGVP